MVLIPPTPQHECLRGSQRVKGLPAVSACGQIWNCRFHRLRRRLEGQRRCVWISSSLPLIYLCLYLRHNADIITCAGTGLYGATKHAIRAVAEALDQEISPLGLRSLYLEPGYFRTSFLEEGKRSTYVPRIDEYADLVNKRYDMFQGLSGKQPGNPDKLAELLIDYVRKEGAFADAGDEFPGGIPVGTDSYTIIKQRLEGQLALLERWKSAICSTEFEK